MAANLYRAILPVDDMARADEFWGRLLALRVDPVVPTRHYLHTGGAILALVDPREHRRKHRPNPEWFYFRVPDLEATFELARELGCAVAPGEGEGIEVRPWGDRSFYTHDPFGNPVCFVDDVASDRSGPAGRYAGRPIANLCKVILPARSLGRSDAFWSHLLGLDVDTSVDNRHFLYCGSCILALIDTMEHDRAHARAPARAFEPNPEIVYFGVPDLDETWQRAERLRAPPLGDPGDDVGVGIRERPWGERSFYVRDPAGNPVCFVDDRTLFTGSEGR
jgi:catechol 2,3-dioxygenase-like lactoylglutathione lyase family enzyme